MRNKDIVLISECIAIPFDEGLKNVLYNIIQSIKNKYDTLVITKTVNQTSGLDVEKIKLNKLFLNKKLYVLLNKSFPKIILYIPEASYTFNSFLRAKILGLMCRMSKVIILGVQHREYSSLQSSLIKRYLKPDLLFLLSKSDKDLFCTMDFKVKVLPPAVDCSKFSPATKEEKERIRSEFNIPRNKKIVLHVGHIKVNRNIECLLEVQKMNEVQVVIVGSTSLLIENDLKERLLKGGIRVIDRYLPDISEIYKMSDMYVFPVVSNKEAIDMPLSVLEAMACNLPVITTRFGGLMDHFEDDDGFRYFSTIEELTQLIRSDRITEINNTEKVDRFTWNNFSNKVIESCNELI